MAQRSTAQARQNLVGTAFVAPFMLVFTAFLLVPLGYAFWMSLHTRSFAFGNEFAGLANYARAFSDPKFHDGLYNIFKFTVVQLPIQLTVALVAALLLDGVTNKLASLSRLLIFTPYAVPVVIGAIMWGFLYSPNFGPWSDTFGRLGIDSPAFLSPSGIFGSLVNTMTWQWAGYYMIIIYAALKSIDPSLYEAARVDGASSMQVSTRIKIPLVMSSLVLVVVFSVIHTLQLFTETHIFRLIASGAVSPEYTPNMYAYNLAFAYQQPNYAAAISFALGVLVFIGSYVFLTVNRKRSGV